MQHELERNIGDVCVLFLNLMHLYLPCHLTSTPPAPYVPQYDACMQLGDSLLLHIFGG